MTAADLAEINNVAALYGHIIDHKEWDRLGEVYAADGVYDGTATGSRRHEGLDAVVHYLSSTVQPLVHHSTNVYVEIALDGLTATGRAKWFVIRPDMSMASGYYIDAWRKTPDGWRLSERASYRLAGEKAPGIG